MKKRQFSLVCFVIFAISCSGNSVFLSSQKEGYKKTVIRHGKPWQNNSFLVSIGIGTFTDSTKPILHSKQNAREFYQTMTTFGLVPKQNARLILDENATKENIVFALKDWLKRRVNKKSVVFFYVSSHGNLFLNESYFVTHDSKENPYGLSHETIAALLRTLKVRVCVLFFDTCHSAYTLLAKEPNHRLSDTFPNTGWIVFSATHQHKLGFAGIFTSHIIKALQGKADFDRNQTVTASELQAYLETRATYYSKEYKTTQKPYFAVMMSGNFIPITFLNMVKEVCVESKPSRARVYINNRYRFTTSDDMNGIFEETCARLPIGEYNLKVVKKGYEVYRLTVKLESKSEKKKELRLTLRKPRDHLRRLKKECDKRNGQKCYQLALLYRERFARCKKVYTDELDGGENTECHQENEFLELHFHRKACLLGYRKQSCAIAGSKLYTQCLQSSVNQVSCEESLPCLYRSCFAKEKESCQKLLIVYARLRLFSHARILSRSNCLQKDNYSCHVHALYLEEGIGGSRNVLESKNWYRRACRLKYKQACLKVQVTNNKSDKAPL